MGQVLRTAWYPRNDYLVRHALIYLGTFAASLSYHHDLLVQSLLWNLYYPKSTLKHSSSASSFHQFLLSLDYLNLKNGYQCVVRITTCGTTCQKFSVLRRPRYTPHRAVFAQTELFAQTIYLHLTFHVMLESAFVFNAIKLYNPQGPPHSTPVSKISLTNAAWILRSRLSFTTTSNFTHTDHRSTTNV